MVMLWRRLQMVLVAVVVAMTAARGIEAIRILRRPDRSPGTDRALLRDTRGSAMLMGSVYLVLMTIPLLLLTIEMPAQTSAYIWAYRTTQSAAQRIAWMCQDTAAWRNGGNLQLTSSCIAAEVAETTRVVQDHHAINTATFSTPAVQELTSGVKGCKAPSAGAGVNAQCLAVELQGDIAFASPLNWLGYNTPGLAFQPAARSVARLVAGK